MAQQQQQIPLPLPPPPAQLLTHAISQSTGLDEKSAQRLLGVNEALENKVKLLENRLSRMQDDEDERSIMAVTTAVPVAAGGGQQQQKQGQVIVMKKVGLVGTGLN